MKEYKLVYLNKVSTRERFFDAIENAINRHGGSISIFDTIDLEMARKP